MPVFDDKNFRALFFDYYKQKKNIAVITRTFQKDYAGYTTRRNKKDKELQKKIMNITGLGFNERQICVSKKECIKSSIKKQIKVISSKTAKTPMIRDAEGVHAITEEDVKQILTPPQKYFDYSNNNINTSNVKPEFDFMDDYATACQEKKYGSQI